ncbi:MAG: nodulation protein NfeD [Actinobacteria bacterium]|nr:nodulation protein NfeD [Actinomycetota bacterium]MCB9388499.1 nodulation protein NfeD [Acidimicrobiia bacterium]
MAARRTEPLCPLTAPLSSASKQRVRAGANRVSLWRVLLMLALVVTPAGAGVAEAGGAEGGGQDRAQVLYATFDGSITPVFADQLDDVLDRAANDSFDLVVIQLDTPGGLASSMRDMVSDILASTVPIVVYVGPPGAQAASAGAVIALAAPVIAMAPGTSIGAATPINIDGGDLGDKVVNEGAAYARGLADIYGRNVDFAESMVTDGAALSSDEAVAEQVADLVANDRAELLGKLDGLVISMPDGSEVTLSTTGARVAEQDLPWFRRILQKLADPTLAFTLISLGSLAIVYEFASPSMGGAGIAGVIMVILGLFALSVLPVNGTGLLLVLLGVTLLGAEAFVPGIGVLGFGGAVSLLLGGLFLFRDAQVRVNPIVLAVVVGVLVGASLLISVLVARTTTAPLASGLDSLIGDRSILKRSPNGTPQVHLQGAWWLAQPASGAELPTVGTPVRVVGFDGLTLTVVRDEDFSPAQ